MNKEEFSRSVLAAVAGDDVDQLAQALTTHAQLIDAPDPNDFKRQTPILVAARMGNAQAVELLIQKGSNAIDTPDKDGWKPIHRAASEGHISVIETLVRFDCQLVNSLFENGSAPIHFAAAAGQSSAIEALIRLDSAGIDAANFDGRVPMHFAAQFGHVDVIELLVRLGSNAIDTPDNNGCTPMQAAASRGHVSVIETLFRLGSNAIDTPANSDWTPMHEAASRGQISVIEALVQFGSQAIDRRDDNGWTPLQGAMSFGTVEAVMVLKALNSNPTSPIKAHDETIELTEDEVVDVRYRMYFGHSLVHRLLILALDRAASQWDAVLVQVDCASSFGSSRVCSRYLNYLAEWADTTPLVRIPSTASLPLTVNDTLLQNLTASSQVLVIAVGAGSSLAAAQSSFNVTGLSFGPDGFVLLGGTTPLKLLMQLSSQAVIINATSLVGVGGDSQLLQTSAPSITTTTSSKGSSSSSSSSSSSCPRGTMYSAYALLETLGFAFLKPLQPLVGSISSSSPINAIQSVRVHHSGPHWPIRMWHYHTQHPLELNEVLNGWGQSDPYDERSWSSMLAEVDRLLEWLVANGQNRWEFALLEGDELWSAFSRSQLRARRLRHVGDMSREYCLPYAVDAPIAFMQQHAFMLVRNITRSSSSSQSSSFSSSSSSSFKFESNNSTLNDELQQIRESIDWLVGEVGIDVLGTESGLSEFSHAPCERVLAWMNETAEYAWSRYGVPTLIKCHCSTGQVCPEYPDPQRPDQPLNFNFLPQLATPLLGVMPHTVQFYGLDDPAPVYHNQNFTYMKQWMFDMAGPLGNGRQVLFYPETEYWVDFDSSVPLFLPVYAQRRLSDLRLIARHQATPGNAPISGQMNFDSGWEWSYWLNSVVCARAAYAPDLADDLDVDDMAAFDGFLQRTVTHVFGDALAGKLSSLLTTLVQTEVQTMIIGGGQSAQSSSSSSSSQTLSPSSIMAHLKSESESVSTLVDENYVAIAYLEGYDTFAQMGELIPPLTVMPTRIGLQAIRKDKQLQQAYTARVLPSLVQLSNTLADTVAELAAAYPLVPDRARFLFDDIFDSASITLLRTEQIIGLYQYAIANDTHALTSAQNALDAAVQVVARREQGYSVPLERVAGWRFNPTVYKFTYLWTVHSLYFWWRDEAIAVADHPVSPCFRNIQDPVDAAFQFPHIDVVLLITQYLRDHFASTPYVDAITDCLNSPIDEPVYNRAMEYPNKSSTGTSL